MIGDAHNFGRRVEARGAWIHKPRPLLWERLLLSRRSPLREALGPGFDFLPDLRFRKSAVERLSLEPLPRGASIADVVGRAIALYSYLGLTDLHDENMALGVRAGKIVFAPLDVEMMFEDLSSPAQTRLLPESDPDYAALYARTAGARRALPWLSPRGETIAALAAAYDGALQTLHARRPLRALKDLPALRTTPIRVTLRATADYHLGAFDPPLLDAEIEQLTRGDIPYFYRLYRAPHVRYYRDRALTRVGLVREFPLAPLLSLARRPAPDALREEGLFALIGAFDQPSIRGVFRAGHLEIELGERALRVNDKVGPRDLSALVQRLRP